MLKEFKEFAMRGNVIDLAIGVVLGTAFSAIVNSLVSDLILPPIGLLLGNVDFSNLFIILKAGEAAPPYLTLSDAHDAGAVTLNYGLFLDSIVSFLIIAFAIFFLVRSINRMTRKEEPPPEAPTTKDCPYCFTEISIQATRCPNCTSQLTD
jgi:large conductance mechanosensitive channel